MDFYVFFFCVCKYLYPEINNIKILTQKYSIFVKICVIHCMYPFVLEYWRKDIEKYFVVALHEYEILINLI